MPELAEVEVARRNVARWWEGKQAVEVVVHDAKVGRGDAAALERVISARVESVDRRGKHLIVRMEGGEALMFHFRMTGKIVASDVPDPRFARLAWRVPGEGWLVFKDQRRLGEVWVFGAGEVDAHEPIAQMGPEPYGLTGPELAELFGTSKRRVKDLLLDQRVIAGVGNIAVSELFWRVGMAPTARAHTVDEELLDALAREMPPYFDWLIEGQMADEIMYMGEAEGVGVENPFDVYAREGEACPRCGEGIERVVFGGRSTYHCPTCQPEK